MATQKEPYIERNPGDLVSAGDWNQVQVDIKDDILAAKEAAKEEIREEGVNNAGNADKFNKKTEGEWVKSLDERYAPKIHDHEETAGYRRYIKRLNEPDPVALIEHKLGRYPLVDVYELLEVVGVGDEKKRQQLSEELQRCKLFVYYGHREADKYGMRVNLHRQRINIGVPLETFLAEYQVEYEDDDTIGDVLNDMLEAFMNANDELDHCRSDWIQSSVHDRRKVSELKEADEWPDVQVAILPRQLRGRNVTSTVKLTSGDGIETTYTVKQHVDVAHGNYDTLAVIVDDKFVVEPVPMGGVPDDVINQIKDQLKPIDVMLLLRS